MDESQFAAFLEVVRTSFPLSAPTPPPPPVQVSHREYKVSWNDLPKLDTSRAGQIDAWFMAFEQRLTAGLIPREYWAEKFSECPLVARTVKMALGVDNLVNYDLIRSSILTNHGPTRATSYFLKIMHEVRGHYREDVREKVLQLQALYNRAATDEGKTDLVTKDLCYAFISAFPKETADHLERQLALVFTQDDPFEHLFKQAPSLPTANSQDFSAINAENNRPTPTLLIQNSEPPKKRARVQKPESDLTTLMATLVDSLQNNQSRPNHLARIPFNRPPQQRIRTSPGSCFGCGGTCADRRACPAQGKQCFNCGTEHHFASVCKRRDNNRQMQANGSQQFPPQYRPFRVNASNQNSKSTSSSFLAVIENPSLRARVVIQFGSTFTSAIADTGASKSFLASHVNHKLRLPLEIQQTSLVQLANGELWKSTYKIRTPFTLGPISGSFEFGLFPGLAVDCILGLDFLSRFLVRINPAGKELTFDHYPTQPLPWISSNESKMSSANLISVPFGNNLSDAEQQTMMSMIERCGEGLFSSEAVPFGKTHLFEHAIEVECSQPIAQRFRPTSPAEREIVRTELNKMLETRAVRPSKSPWASPIVLVPKKDGTTRFCIDYRRLNSVTRKNSFPLPRISDVLESFSGKKYFSTLDAASGYWQIPIKEEDIPKTAFTCTEGLFEFLVMPFGLCNAPATYQAAMNELFADLIGRSVYVYIDDIIIASETWSAHLKEVQEVLRRLRSANIMLKAAKCMFGADKVEYLGHILTSRGISPDPRKLEKLRSFPIPTNISQLRAFLGLANYYRRFVRNFATIASPLYPLLSTTGKWLWDDSHQAAFTRILSAVESDAVLPHPRFDLPFILDCDASDSGIACILSQNVDGVERPVMFDSRPTATGEKKWHIREKEALSIIWGLQRMRRFILGRPFTVRSDHSSLAWLLQAKSGRLARWAIQVSEFAPFQIIHRSGKTHANVDAFTRTFTDSDCVPDYATPVHLLLSTFCPEVPIPSFLPSLTEIGKAQVEDPFCVLIKQKRLPQLESRDECLGISMHNRWRPILPASLLERVTRTLHEGPLHAHFGFRRTLARISQYFIVPSASRQIKSLINLCLACQQRKPSIPRHGLLASKPPSTPWKTVSTDFCGPYLQSDHGNKYILVFVDNFTKWVELVPLPNQLASTVCAAFYERIICRHGVPRMLLSDRGPQFKSNLIEFLCASFGIKKIFSSAYYPQGDGFAERFMRTLNNSLSILTTDTPTQWDVYVPGLQFAYNSSEHSATGHTPFYLNTGRVPSLPEGGDWTDNMDFPNINNYVKHLKSTITKAIEDARLSVQKYWDRVAKQYNKNRRPIQLQIGDLVLVRLSEWDKTKFPCRKLAPRWSPISKIVQVHKNGKSYGVDRPGHPIETVNISRLLPVDADVWRNNNTGYAKEGRNNTIEDSEMDGSDQEEIVVATAPIHSESAEYIETPVPSEGSTAPLIDITSSSKSGFVDISSSSQSVLVDISSQQSNSTNTQESYSTNTQEHESDKTFYGGSTSE